MDVNLVIVVNDAVEDRHFQHLAGTGLRWVPETSGTVVEDRLDSLKSDVESLRSLSHDDSCTMLYVEY